MSSVTDQKPSATPEQAVSWFPREELAVTIGYIVLGSLWIVLTDDAVDKLFDQPFASTWVQTCKGLNFIFTTGLLLYLVLRRSHHRRRKAEEVSRLTQERFELAVRAATDAIWDWDLRTNVIWWSDGFRKLFGTNTAGSPSTIDSWTARLHPEDRERVAAGLHRVVDSGGEAWADEYRFCRKDGSHAFVQDRGFVLRDAAGQALRMVGGMSDITPRKTAEDNLERSRRQLRALLARLHSLREEERTRISREIHDELGQLLTAIKMDLRWIEKRLEERNDDALNALLDKAVEAGALTDTTIASVQKIATELRPGALDTLGLPAAIRQEAQQFQERTGVTCRAELPEPAGEFSRELATTAFRILQEALTNVARHAQATGVVIRLREDLGQVVLEVEDNGRGLTPGTLADAKSLGLVGMRERAAALDGSLAAEPAMPRGTRVTLRLPRVEGGAEAAQTP